MMDTIVQVEQAAGQAVSATEAEELENPVQTQKLDAEANKDSVMHRVQEHLNKVASADAAASCGAVQAAEVAAGAIVAAAQDEAVQQADAIVAKAEEEASDIALATAAPIEE